MSNSSHIATANQHVLVRLPSEGLKIVQLIPDGVITLGKFGSFAVNDVLGHALGTTFEIVDNGLKVIKNLTQEAVESAEDLDIMEDDDDDMVKDKLTKLLAASAENNQNIVNNGASIQKLTSEEIDQLKKNGTGSNMGQSIIHRIIEGHGGFDKKTVFSQQKYIKRKQQKFLRRFTMDYLGATELMHYYSERDHSRLLEMSEESLGGLMTYANVRPGGKYLLIDDTSGIILYAMLERMNLQGTIVLIHENEHANYSCLKHSNYTEEQISSVVKTINWLQVAEPDNEMIDFEEYSEATLNEMKAPKRSQYYKRLKRSQDINSVISLVKQGGFDGLVSVTTLDPVSFLPLVIPKVGGSRPIVVYSQYKETLLDTFHSISSDKRVLAPTILESRVRPYQTILGRIHPRMTMRGYGGYILMATRVFPRETVQAVGRGMTKRKQPAEEKKEDTNDEKKEEKNKSDEKEQNEDTMDVDEKSKHDKRLEEFI